MLPESSDQVVFEDELWSAGVAGGIPGWIRLQTKRHGDWSWGLTSEEATSFGPVLARLSSALRDVCGAETVYTIALGDNSMHFHTLLIPRAADAPPELRGPGLLAKAPELVNHDEAHRIADLLRSRVASD